METVAGFLLGILALITTGAFGVLILGIVGFMLYFVLLVTIVDPVYWLVTRTHLKEWKEFMHLPRESDFF